MLGIELTPEHPVDRVGRLGRLAAGVGFETIYVSHHYNNRDAFTALADIAGATSTSRLGPGVVNPYETHPVSLASRMATLDEFADGRGVFGVGAGDRSTLSNLGIDHREPLRRVLETIQVARQLWAGDRVDHDGTFRADDAGLNYTPPTPGTIPVHVGAQGPDMIRMAAKHGDAVLFNGAHPRDVTWATERVAEGRAERSPERGPLTFTVYASVSVATGESAAREAARPPVAFIVAGAPSSVLDRHDVDRDRASTIGAAISAGDFSTATDAVTDRMLDAFCVAGTPEQVVDRLSSIATDVDGIVVGSPLGPDPETAIELAGTLGRRLPV